MNRPLIILGIETSCDETAAAILRLKDSRAEILSETIYSQIREHAPYQGVVPEIAARAHAEMADRVISEAMQGAGLSFAELDGVAATTGPGLIGGVMVGMMSGKAIAQVAGIKFIPINHLEGHALSPRLETMCDFPYLLLLVSGGHCQFLSVKGLGDYTRLGSTIDDAAGEAFDKTAKVLGLGFPGGPEVEKYARSGDAKRFDFPRPLIRRENLEMSFAGLKTAVARTAQAVPKLDEQTKADICASFQAAICDVLASKSARALAAFATAEGGAKRFVVAGGVAANTEIRKSLDKIATQAGAVLIAPPLPHCTDNAAMIALAGAMRLEAGMVPPASLETAARPRWPLDEASAAANPAYGAGKRGAKA